MCDQAQLGYATTYELIRELDARAAVALAQPGQNMSLSYRTVDGGGKDILRRILQERDRLVEEHARMIGGDDIGSD